MEASDGDLWRDAYGRLQTPFVRLANGALTTDVPPHGTHANCARRRHCSRRSLWTGASRPTHSYCISPLTSTGGRPVAGLLTGVDTRTCGACRSSSVKRSPQGPVHIITLATAPRPRLPLVRVRSNRQV